MYHDAKEAHRDTTKEMFTMLVARYRFLFRLSYCVQPNTLRLISIEAVVP